MTKKLLFICFCLIGISAQAQFANTAPIKGDYLYASITEVSNIQYKEFLSALKSADKMEEYRKNLTDTLVWSDPMFYSGPYTDYYHMHPAYNDYPVVGVTYENALAFCAWLTDSLNTQLKRNKSYIKKVVVRLPTQAEWEYAARGGFDTNTVYPWGTGELLGYRKDMDLFGKRKFNYGKWAALRADKSRKPKGEKVHLANYRAAVDHDYGIAGALMDNADITAPVTSYWPNAFGLYNMSGNVAEMVQEKGVTKGGCWLSSGYYLQIDAESYYSDTVKASSGIGFRYFIEVLELAPSKRLAVQEVSSPIYLDKHVAKVKDKLYAGKYEATNLEFNLFLNDLKNKKPEEYNQYQIDNTGWEKYTEYPYFQMYGSYYAYDNYPVVNITYEAATKFCAWLTEQYNASPKKKHQKVVFRLPTEAEWELAARGGLDLSPYPWGGPYVRNSKGNYLCNFNPREGRFLKMDADGHSVYDYPNGDISITRDLDGADKTCPVGSYFPNGFGLYNCSGNAAEMLQEKGISRGGSWTSTEEDVIVSSRSTYTEANATLGFRYFMEVLEE